MRKPRRAVSGFTTGAIVAAAIAGAAETADANVRGPVVVDDFGHWGLARLGSPPVEFSGGRQRADRSIAYRLPADARQGPDRWYLLQLGFTAEIDPSSGAGSVFVDGSTNGRTAVSVELEVSRRHHRVRVVTKTLDLTTGAGRRVTVGPRVRGTSVSFLQNRGVSGGVNTLRFEVERYGDVRLRRVSISSDSGLVVSRRSPAHLALEPRLPTTDLEVGEKAKLGYRLRNTGDRPAMDVLVGVQSHHRALRISGANQKRIGRLDQSADGAFVVEARRPGRRRLTLAASSSNANNPVVELEVDVPRPKPEDGAEGTGWVLGGTVAGVTGAGIIVYSAARRSRRSRRS